MKARSLKVGGLSVLLGLLWPGWAHGSSDIYVKPDYGGPEWGTQLNPFTDFWRADQHAEPGDTIHLDARVYPSNITLAKPMTVTSTNGTAVIGHPYWFPIEVGAYLYGVVYKPGDSWITTPGFESFVDGAGDLDVNRLRYVMLAPLWMPPRDKVKYVFIFSSGQQQFPQRGVGGGKPQITTGALDGWADDFPVSWTRVYRNISPDSIASKLIVDAPNHDYGPHNTLLLLAFKGGLQGPQEPVILPFTIEDRKKIIDGYYAYLNDKADFNNVDVVYLCGISRGGALASRLGKRIRKYNSKPEIFISTIDGHVNGPTHEMYSTIFTVPNPHFPLRYARWTEIDKFYTSMTDDESLLPQDGPYDPSLTEGLHVFNTVTSAGVLLINEAFYTYCSGTSLLTAHLEYPNLWGFFKQRWVNYNHQVICEEWKSDVGPEHVEWFLNEAFPPE